MAITFNHLNLLMATDSDAKYLLTEVMGLASGNRPNFPFKGQWLYQGDKALIHVIESDTQQASIGHIAFEIDIELNALRQKLNIGRIKYNVRQLPDSERVQVFVRAGEVVFELITIDKPNQQEFNVFSQHQELV